MCTRRCVFVAVLLAVIVSPIAADETDIDMIATALLDRFQLGNACEPVNLSVEGIDTEAMARGLTQENIMTMVRSRLRAARLYRRESKPYLAVLVTAVPEGTAFSVAVKFKKVLSDPTAPALLRELEEGTFALGLAVTWERSVVGQSREASFILSGVSRLTDEFIDEYLRVNAPACSRGPLDP